MRETVALSRGSFGSELISEECLPVRQCDFWDPKLGAKIFMITEETQLTNPEKYCSDFFESEVKKIDKKNKIDASLENFSSCLGASKLIKDGWETEAIPEAVNKSSGKVGFFAKIFGKSV